MFVYTVKLDANLSHHKELEKRFRMADDIYQKTLREILKRVRKQKKDPRYKQAYKLPKGQERNDIKKVGLGVRTKTIGDEQVQRDLYSAFLLQHVENDGYTVNLQKCEEDFEQFLEHQQQTMSELTTDLKSTGKDTFHIKTGKDDENGIQKTIE